MQGGCGIWKAAADIMRDGLYDDDDDDVGCVDNASITVLESFLIATWEILRKSGAWTAVWTEEGKMGRRCK